MTPVAGSAVYVAIEVVQAKLGERPSSFALFHVGLSEGGEQRLTYQVIPDSGTGELTGLSGQLQLDNTEKVHHYTMMYTLPAL
ncbi:DUF3224 domain-containing protein [Deinococcus detaillensis]|nr:DUF3224 domain-containing protein [Deinococcus detaillensis]